MSDETRFVGQGEIIEELNELADEGVGWVLDKHDVRLIKRAIRVIKDADCWIDILKGRLYHGKR